MPGYQLIEQESFRRGLEAHPIQMGLLDFLRELAEDSFPFPKFYQIRITGLEEVLYAARPDERDLALEIRRRLQRAASDLERRLMSVQFVFKGKLFKGDSLWVEFRGVRLPVDLIFGSPSRTEDPHGTGYYHTTFNLTNGG